MDDRSDDPLRSETLPRPDGFQRLLREIDDEADAGSEGDTAEDNNAAEEGDTVEEGNAGNTADDGNAAEEGNTAKAVEEPDAGEAGGGDASVGSAEADVLAMVLFGVAVVVALVLLLL